MSATQDQDNRVLGSYKHFSIVDQLQRNQLQMCSNQSVNMIKHSAFCKWSYCLFTMYLFCNHVLWCDPEILSMNNCISLDKCWLSVSCTYSKQHQFCLHCGVAFTFSYTLVNKVVTVVDYQLINAKNSEYLFVSNNIIRSSCTYISINIKVPLISFRDITLF